MILEAIKRGEKLNEQPEKINKTMLSFIFIPQIKSAIAEKFSIPKADVKKVVFFINKKSDSIKIICNDALETETNATGQLSAASTAIENAIKKQLKGELIAYALEVLIPEKQFNAEVYIILPNGEKIKQTLKNVI